MEQDCILVRVARLVSYDRATVSLAHTALSSYLRRDPDTCTEVDFERKPCELP